jgi:hypothetical protein
MKRNNVKPNTLYPTTNASINRVKGEEGEILNKEREVKDTFLLGNWKKQVEYLKQSLTNEK